ncbi:hypothetical protein [Alicyclobacillus acidiphilus]|uniref:hypothetical protein n=1 Tax=Alicyclobacillus acidiphilus TaxID=182455 RepID=UPI00083088E7|nr:hypothetical protein [Alicyclobacillus acidiphilus]
MEQKAFAIHETMEVHELLAMKNVCVTKSLTMQVLVSDPPLLSLLKTCVATDRRHIQELRDLMSDARIMTNHQGATRP